LTKFGGPPEKKLQNETFELQNKKLTLAM